MAIETITLAVGVPSYRLRATLDGVEFELVLRWSEREEHWYLDLHDANGMPLVGCIKVVVNWPLLYRFRSLEGLPAGELMAVDLRTPPQDPGLDDLGDAVSLCYGPREEVVGAMTVNVP